MHPPTRARGSFIITLLRASTRQLARPSRVHHGWLTRQNHNAPTKSKLQNKKADAIVIGGGPAGIAAVGNLLEHIPGGKVVWIDKFFEGGSIGQLYREVPSYSPVEDFLRYARALKTFSDICDAAPTPNAITELEKLDPEMTCMLSYAADMLRLVSDGLRQHERVESIVGNVTRSTRNPTTKRWTVTIEPHQIGTDRNAIQHQAPMLVYCTGCQPRAEALPVETDRLSVDTALAPSRLAKILPPGEPRTVAVIGDGHSAVLVLRNLFRLAAMSHPRLRIRWLTRRAHLRYVQETWDGVLVDENTGLMGEAARFARTQLEGDALRTSDAGAFITRVLLPAPPPTNPKNKRRRGLERAAARASENQQQQEAEADAKAKAEAAKSEAAKSEAAILARSLRDVDFVVQAIGFARGRVPETGRPAAMAGKKRRLVHNALRGSMFPASEPRETVIGLFGAGSAFPELELTSEGWRQPAVGAWKFMRFLRRVVPRWAEAAEEGMFTKKAIKEWTEGLERKKKARKKRGLPLR